MPLAAWLYERRLRLLTLLTVLLGAATLLGVQGHNVNKPIGFDDTPAVWEMPRSEAQGINTGGAQRAARVVERRVPAEADIGVVLGSNDPSYLLYGTSLRRHLVKLRARDAAHDAKARGIRWIAASPDAGALGPSPGWRVQVVRGGWKLLTSRAPVTGGRDGELITSRQ